jgi:hypothetical protein
MLLQQDWFSIENSSSNGSVAYHGTMVKIKVKMVKCSYCEKNKGLRRIRAGRSQHNNTQHSKFKFHLPISLNPLTAPSPPTLDRLPMPPLPLPRQFTTRRLPASTDLRLIFRPHEPDPLHVTFPRKEKRERRVECFVLHREQGR